MNPKQPNLFRALPSVDQALDALALLAQNSEPGSKPGSEPGLRQIPRSLQKDYINLFLDQCRARIRAQINEGHTGDAGQLNLEALLPALAAFVLRKGQPHFRRVVNASGVVIHTNLGRSILADEACKAVDLACRHYSNLEFDLESGERGSRYSHVVEILRKLTGAESALVVNNNAAAVLLVMDSLCKGREVVVSRGELVEIGGSFRIPEVIERSGCLLREVGATNRTHLADFEKALGPESAAILKVHTSNFRILGFHSQPDMAALSKLALEHGIPLINDLGSGSFCDFSVAGSASSASSAVSTGGLAPGSTPGSSGVSAAVLAGLNDEPTVQQTVAAGADVITFSGDKVLGGPQAGIIIGKEKYLAQIRKNPLNRALRIDKMTLAALEATLRLYTEPKLALERIPTLAMITATPEQLKRKARSLKRGLERSLREHQEQHPAKTPDRALAPAAAKTMKNAAAPDSPGSTGSKDTAAGDAALTSQDAVTGAAAGNNKGLAAKKPETRIECIPGVSRVGGGAFPERDLPTTLVSIRSGRLSATELRQRLLQAEIPVIGRIEDQAFCLDPRTVTPSDYPVIFKALGSILA